jgi:hypothetical protein
MGYTAPLLPVDEGLLPGYAREALAGAQHYYELRWPELFHRLIVDYEEPSLLPASQRIAELFLHHGLALRACGGDPDRDAAPLQTVSALDEAVEGQRHALREALRRLERCEPDERQRASLLLRLRAPTALTEPCWLDHVSQPGTQPARLVNLLFALYCRRRGGEGMDGAAQRYRRRCQDHGLLLPEAGSAAFGKLPQLPEAAYVPAVFHLAIGRHARLFFPELIGLTLAYYRLSPDSLGGVFDPDDGEPAVQALLAELQSLSAAIGSPHLERRICCGFRTEAQLQRLFWRQAANQAEHERRRSPRQQMCELVQRMARYAGNHHIGVRVQGRPLTDWLQQAQTEPQAFVDMLGQSGYFDRRDPARSRFLQLMGFDGPMFAIFTREDAQVVKRWAASLAAEPVPELAASGCPPDTAGSVREAAAALPPDGNEAGRWRIEDDAAPAGLRELFYRLINVDFFPSILPQARRYAADVLDQARACLTSERSYRYMAPAYFDYSPQALEQRVEQIYFDKLLGDYRPPTRIPPKAQVVARHTMLALGNLIDGTWIHRIAKAGQYGDPAAERIFGIYADEMGYGDMRRNHIMVMRRVLDSMRVELPEMAARAYAYNESVPERSFAFLAYELALSLFPHSYYPEILGLNLAIENYGLGSFRLDEIAQLKHYGLDDTYERIHLTIDNIFTGHVRTAVQAIQAHLDGLACRSGPAGVQQSWRRVWTGYASLAKFVE